MANQSTLRHSSAAEAAIAAFLDHYGGPVVRRWRQIRRLTTTTPKTKTTQLLATVCLLLTITLSGAGLGRWWRRRRRRQREQEQQGRTLLRTNSFLHNKDGSRTVYVAYPYGEEKGKGGKPAKVTIRTTKELTLEAHRRLFLNPPRVSGLEGLQGLQGQQGFAPGTQTKPGLNLAFLHQFLSLMSIMIPRWTSKEAGLLVSHAVFLALRTYLSLVVARLDGRIVRDLVAGNGKMFALGIVQWLGLGGVASYTNATIKFLECKVSIAFRTRLTRYIHDLYLNDRLTYYKLGNLDGGLGQQAADQFITQDLTLFCGAAAGIYSSLGKPLIDLAVFNYQLYRALGPLALAGILSNYVVTASLLRRLSPPFGKLKAVEGRREGDFRSLHGRLIANAEEVAFYGGADLEKQTLNREFRDLRSWMEGIYLLKIRYHILEEFVVKYSWSAYGYLLSALPVFLPAWGGGDGATELVSSLVHRDSSSSSRDTTVHERTRTKHFITNRRLMLSLADAGGRMMYSIKDLAELAGYTSRVYTLIATLHRVHANAYYPPRGGRPPAELYSLADVQGTVQKGFDGVRLENVPIVAPALWPHGGDDLIESLSLIVRQGEHLLISGPNGAGKTAIARIVAGLWPVYRGLVSRPKSTGEDGIFFLPQRPYLSIGTLRDQVIYPDGEADMREKQRNEADHLQPVLDAVHLGYLPAREGGWDTKKEWKDVLSGGEKQRMALARLLYHAPRYAVLDEATSAVSADVEGLLYETCKARGITLITISTRASLKKYHTFHLALGQGDSDSTEGWSWERIGTEREKQNVARELQELRSQLAQVDAWRKRHAEIEAKLAEVWVEGDASRDESRDEPQDESPLEAGVSSAEASVPDETTKTDRLGESSGELVASRVSTE